MLIEAVYRRCFAMINGFVFLGDVVFGVILRLDSWTLDI